MKITDFVGIAQAVAARSKDHSTKVGALIIGPDFEIRSTGWNGFPRGVMEYDFRIDNRQTKYAFTAHAELNAVCNAARVGTPTKDCVMLVTSLHPCQECAKAIVQAGIKTVYAPKDRDAEAAMRWDQSAGVAGEILEEAGVSVIWY
jgi:dCMP deaminase